MAKRRQKADRSQTARRSPTEQLDQGVEATMADARPPRVNAGIAALLEIAGELRGLPRQEFKMQLKASLKKSALPTPSKSALTARRRHGIATPYLMIRDASRAIDFYKRAFGATELSRMADPSGHIAHAEIKIGDAPIMIAEEEPRYFNLSPDSLGGSSAFVHVYVDDIDAFARRAQRGGAKVLEAPQDYPYGDRRGKFVDPFGHVWMVATHRHDVTLEQMKADWDRSVAVEKAKSIPKPEGYHSITPYLQVNGAAQLIDFLKRAFGAEEVMRVNQPDGTIGHAQMRVSGSVVELADANQRFKPNPTAIWLFVDDVDATYQRALEAGAESMHGPVDQDYGNREASVKDPFGNHWYLAKRLEAAEPWPPELRSLTPYLHPKGAAKLIDFLKDAFGAEEAEFHADEQGVVQHAQLRIGDSIVAMGEAHGEYPPMPPALHLYVADADATYQSALRAGAESLYAPRDEPYGDRASGVTDPFGNVWYIATHQHPEKRAALSAHTAPQAVPTLPGGIMPFMYFEDAGAAAEFYKKVFQATELHRELEQGKASHVQLTIGSTRVMLSDATTAHVAEHVARGFVRTPHQLGGTPLHLYVYVPDADAAFQRALDSGSEMVEPMENKQWGDRCGGVKDPFGHIWYIATPLKDVRR
jgi:PhnB protein